MNRLTDLLEQQYGLALVLALSALSATLPAGPCLEGLVHDNAVTAP